MLTIVEQAENLKVKLPIHKKSNQNSISEKIQSYQTNGPFSPIGLPK